VNARESVVGRVYMHCWNEPYNTGSRRRPRDGETSARQSTYAVHYSSWRCKYTRYIPCTAPHHIKLHTVYRTCCMLFIHHVTCMQALGITPSCSSDCSGNGDEICGGGMTNSLYRVVPCASEYAVPGEYAQPVLVRGRSHTVTFRSSFVVCATLYRLNRGQTTSFELLSILNAVLRNLLPIVANK
jgi:hypothetical protein